MYYYSFGKTYAEVAKIIGVSVRTVNRDMKIVNNSKHYRKLLMALLEKNLYPDLSTSSEDVLDPNVLQEFHRSF